MNLRIPTAFLLATLVPAVAAAQGEISDLSEAASGSDPSGSFVTLRWTKPTGAFYYQVRVTTDGPITNEAGWNLATPQAISPEWPSPQPGTQAEERTLGGIPVNTPCWFAVRWQDGGFPAFVSGISNPVEVTIDTLAPSKPLQLEFLSAGAGSAELRWQAPGDNGTSGTATSYEIRYASFAIDVTTFAAATPVNGGAPAPLSASTPQTAKVGINSAGAIYHFALRAIDEDGNAGQVSDAASGFVPAGSSMGGPPSLGGTSDGGGGGGGGCSSAGVTRPLPIAALLASVALALVLRRRRALALLLPASLLLAAITASSSGPLIGPLIKVAQVNVGVGGTIHYHNNDIAYNATDDMYFSVYTRASATTGSMDLMGATLNPVTGDVGFTVTIDASEPHAQVPSVAWNPSTNRFLVAYIQHPIQLKFAGDGTGAIPGQITIRAMTLDGAGRPADGSATFQVDDGTAKRCAAPRIACNGTDWLVVWEEHGSDKNDPTPGRHMVGRIVRGTSTNAAPLFAGTPFPISSGTGDQLPVAASLGSGSDFLVLWGAWDSAGGAVSGRTVRASDGFPGPLHRYDDPVAAPADTIAPCVAANEADGEYLVGWGTYVRRATPDGTPVGATPAVIDDPDGGIFIGTLAWNAATLEYAVAWDRPEQDPGGAPLLQLVVTQLAASDLSIVRSAVPVISLDAYRYSPSYGYGPMASIAMRAGTPQCLVQWRPVGDWNMLWDVWAQRYDMSNPPADPSPASLLQGHVDAADPAAFSGLPAGSTVVSLTRRMTLRTGPMSDPDRGNLLRLEVELTSGAGTFTFEQSPAVSPGSTGEVTTDPLPNGNYQWRARVLDNTGGASNWIAFNPAGAGPDFTLAIPNQAPPAPSLGPTATTGQFRMDGATPLAAGEETDQGAVVLRADLPADVDGDLLRLEVEIKPVGIPFVGLATATSAYGPPGNRPVIVPVAPGQSYHWQAWTRDNSGSIHSSGPNAAVSAAVSFGGNADPGDADFSRAPNRAPLAPVLESGSDPLGQFEADGRTAMVVGAAVIEQTMVFRGRVGDPDGDDCAIQIVVRPVDQPLDEAITVTGTFAANGGISAAPLPGLAPGRYHWWARAIDAYGEESAAFTPFGGNGDDVPADADFEILATPVPPPPPPPPPPVGSLGTPSCGGSAAGGFGLLAVGAALAATSGRARPARLRPTSGRRSGR